MCKVCEQRGYISYLENYISTLNNSIDFVDMQIDMMKEEPPETFVEPDYKEFVVRMRDCLDNWRDMEREQLEDAKLDLVKLEEEQSDNSSDPTSN
jgi:hypothetical protein